MNKKTVAIGCFAAIGAAIGLNVNNSTNEVSVTELISTNTEALGYCPNGCVDGNVGCYCNGPWGTYKEYS